MDMTTKTTNEEIRFVLQRAMLFGINRGAKVERRKHFARYTFMMAAGFVLGVLGHSVAVAL